MIRVTNMRDMQTYLDSERSEQADLVSEKEAERAKLGSKVFGQKLRQEPPGLRKGRQKKLERLSKGLSPLDGRALRLNQKIDNLSDILTGNHSGTLHVKGKVLGSLEGQAKGYTLFFGDSPVVEWQGNNRFDYVFSSAKSKPMETVEISLPLNPSVMLGRMDLESRTGDYFTESGLYVVKDAEAIRDIYRKVREGIEIFPRPENPLGLYERRMRGDSPRKEEPKPRHWGQEYLRSLATGEVTEGELFATGFQYQVFPIGEYMVVEGNEEGRATYVFRGAHFDELRHRQRALLLLERPEGFVDRAIHGANPEKWRETIEELTKG